MIVTSKYILKNIVFNLLEKYILQFSLLKKNISRSGLEILRMSEWKENQIKITGLGD